MCVCEISSEKLFGPNNKRDFKIIARIIPHLLLCHQRSPTFAIVLWLNNDEQIATSSRRLIVGGALGKRMTHFGKLTERSRVLGGTSESQRSPVRVTLNKTMVLSWPTNSDAGERWGIWRP